MPRLSLVFFIFLFFGLVWYRYILNSILLALNESERTKVQRATPEGVILSLSASCNYKRDGIFVKNFNGVCQHVITVSSWSNIASRFSMLLVQQIDEKVKNEWVILIFCWVHLWWCFNTAFVPTNQSFSDMIYLFLLFTFSLFFLIINWWLEWPILKSMIF